MEDFSKACSFELSASRGIDLRSRRVEFAARLTAGLGNDAAAGGDGTVDRATPDVEVGRGARVIARVDGELTATTGAGADALPLDGTDQSVVANTSAITIPDRRPEAKAIGLPDGRICLRPDILPDAFATAGTTGANTCNTGGVDGCSAGRTGGAFASPFS